ncbi:MAG TPA: sigma-54 dependent transcriptional regulator [Candidatus Acidoferrum sp.]|nr:sigma-54 dependent transcriptional regulator [Candidatus Acidoferrum sp.]
MTTLERPGPVLPDHVLFGHSPAMAEIHARAVRICRTNVPILLCGEGGTGKEGLARWIHCNSEYGAGEFVKVNCAAIPGTLLESELFGYEKGAFTGASNVKPGRVEFAHRGTLFLDEIVDLDMNLQSKLLHFLQDGTFSRIGDQGERKVDARLICATNKDVEAEMIAGRFRQDLFYRIHVFRLRMPALRERRDDIPLLAEYFRKQYEKQFEKTAEAFPPELLEYLKNLAWAGNIRELSNGVARYVLLGPEAAIYQEVPTGRTKRVIPQNNNGDGHFTLKRMSKDAIKEMEKNVILETLRANQWNRRKTALALKISYRALIYKIRDAGLASRRVALQRVPGGDALRIGGN